MATGSHLFAPEGSLGPLQVIPTRGAHEQIYVDKELLEGLVYLGLVEYAPDYGPNANVYRPIEPADADKVRSWVIGT